MDLEMGVIGELFWEIGVKWMLVSVCSVGLLVLGLLVLCIYLFVNWESCLLNCLVWIGWFNKV